MYYIFIEFILLLYNFLVFSFAWYKGYMICLTSFRKCFDVLLAFTCARAIGNLLSICFGFNTLVCIRSEMSFSLSQLSYWIYFVFKTVKKFYFPLRILITFLKVSVFLFGYFGSVDSLNLSISSFKFICS